jgi:hypothetical protein
VKLMLAEYLPPAVPDERNFAAIPLLQDAFLQPRPPNPLDLAQSDRVKQPPLDTVFKSRPIDLTAWQKFFVATNLLDAPGENPASDILKALERYAPQFEQLRAAGTRPESRFPVRYEDGATTALPHLQLIQSAARLYALRLAAHLALGDSAAAYEDFRGGLRLYTALEKEPTLIAGLVRLATLGVLENAVWGGLTRHQWAAPELEKISADLANLRLMDDYLLGLGSERGFSNMIHEQLIQKGSGELSDLLPMISNGAVFHPAAAAVFSLYPSGWLRLSQTRANQYLDEMQARVSQDPPRIFPERAVPSLPRRLAEVSLLDRLRYLLFLNLAPALSEVERTYAYGQTMLDQTRIGCALERYRLAHGAFPTSLEALVPDFLPALPRDVMTGEPFHYRAVGDDVYTLYAVAWNLVDDGGKSDPKANNKQQLDWVWTVTGK